MDPDHVDGFFYGLFMDERVLREAEIRTSNFRRAYVSDFELRIGQRATRVPSPGARAHGRLITLAREDLERLYNAPGLEAYRPETVVAQTFEGEVIPALCYNLDKAPDPEERNPEYVTRMRSVLERLGFPVEYVESVK